MFTIYLSTGRICFWSVYLAVCLSLCNYCYADYSNWQNGHLLPYCSLSVFLAVY